MTSAAPFGRLLSAMVTPMRADGSVDLEAAGRLAGHLVDEGHDGLIVNGTTGESATTTDDEKIDMVRVVKEAVGDRAHIVAGAGTYDTAHSTHLARRSAEVGADALLVVTPYYNKPPQEGLLAHFRTVADSTALPVMLYDIPHRSGVPIETATLLALAEHERIVAVKDAKGDFWASTHVMHATDLAYYCGDDVLALPQVAQGAVGLVGVTSQVASRPFADLLAAAAEGRRDDAIRRHRALLPIIDAVMTVTQGVIMAKAGLVARGLLDCDAVRLPLVAATPGQRELVVGALTESGLR